MSEVISLDIQDAGNTGISQYYYMSFNLVWWHMHHEFEASLERDPSPKEKLKVNFSYMILEYGPFSECELFHSLMILVSIIATYLREHGSRVIITV